MSQRPSAARRASQQSSEHVDDAFIAHVQAGRHADAHALLARAYREAVPVDLFSAAIEKNAYLKTTQLIGCYHEITNDHVLHRRDCILRSDAGVQYFTLLFTLEDGEWRIAGVTIGGIQALPDYGDAALWKKVER